MLVASQSNVLIKVATKYISNISNILKVAAIENNSSVDPSDLVQIVGEVVSLPKEITTDKRGYENFSTKDISVGDTAIFRYDLIYSFRDISKQERVFRNRIWYNGEEYWCCDIQKIFGVIRNWNIIMVNGYVMLTDFIPSPIVLPTYARQASGAQQAEVMHVGYHQNEIVAGDTVFFNPNLAAKYQINGKSFRVIQQKQILGKAVK